MTDEEWDRATDRDRDGHVAEELGGDDCDDAEPTVNPDATELCGDDVDNDCDGETDDVGLGSSLFYADADDDGFGDPDTVTEACSLPDHHVPSLLAGEDCDDGAPGTRPGATEVWYDGIDADCAGDDDHDQDHDGFTVLGAPHGSADDCDDDPTDDVFVSAALVHTGAPERWYDGVDQNCDGVEWDQDGDGFTRTGAPDGTADDCDDDPTDDGPITASLVHPGATDACYDGRDDDCGGGSDYDCDHDGYILEGVPAIQGGDCDDLDDEVNPGTPEVCGNFKDDDCVAATDCRLEGELGFLDTVPVRFNFGSNGDPTLIGTMSMTASGAANLVMYGTPNDVVSFEWTGEAFEVVAAAYVIFPKGVADLDGDGVGDIAVKCASSQSTCVYYGPFAGSLDTTTEAPDEVWIGSASPAYGPLGVWTASEPEHTVAVVTGTSGTLLFNGTPTIATAAAARASTTQAWVDTRQTPSVCTSQGKQWFVARFNWGGPVVHALASDAVGAVEPSSNARLSPDVVGPLLVCADWDGDGDQEVIVTDRQAAPTGGASVYEVPFTQADTPSIASFDAIAAAAADLDGDGYPDLVVAHSDSSVSITYGPLGRALDASPRYLSAPDVVLTEVGYPLVDEMWPVGDLDLDGVDDVLIRRNKTLFLLPGGGM